MALYLVCGIVVSLIGLWIIFRLLAWIVLFTLHRLLHIRASIGQVGLFTLGRIQVNPIPGVSIEIERLWLSSSFINTDVKKLIAVCAGDVRVTLEHNVLAQRVGDRGANAQFRSESEKRKKLLNILGWIQHFSLILDHVNVNILNVFNTECLLHLLVHEINAHVTLTEPSLEISLDIDALDSKLLKSSSNENAGEEPCLARYSATHHLQLHVNIIEKKPQVIYSNLQKTNVHISEGLLTLIDGVIQKQKSSESSSSEISELSQVSSSSLSSSSMLSSSPAPSSSSSSQSSADTLHSHPIINRLPKEVHFSACETQVTISRDTASRMLLVGVEDFNLDFENQTQASSLQGHVRLSMKGFSAASPQINLSNIKYTEFKLEVDEKSITTSLLAKSCFLGYHHEEVQYWMAMFKKRTKKKAVTVAQPPAPSASSAPSISNASLYSEFFKRVISVKVELEEGSSMVASATCNGIKAGVAHVKLTQCLRLKQGDEDVECPDMRFELELRALYCKLSNYAVPSAELTSKHHHWNTVIFLGMLISKLNKISSEVNLDSMLDSIQLEWSSYLASTLLQLMNAFHRSPPITATRSPTSPTRSDRILQPGTTSSLRPLITAATVNIQCSNINVYICSELKVGVLLRMDSLNAKQRASEIAVVFHGTKFVYLDLTNRFQPIVRSHELHNYNGHIKTADLSFKYKNKEMMLRVGHEVYFLWTTSMHTCIFQASKEVKDVLDKYKSAKPGDNGQSGGISQPAPSAKSTGKTFSFSLVARANSMIAFQLDKTHKVSISIPDFQAVVKKQSVTIALPQTSITFDQHDIFNIQGLVIQSEHHGKTLQLERQGFPDIQEPTNRAWSISCDKLDIIFPYKYNLSESMELIINLNKWRKLVHGTVKKPFTVDSPLPPDIVIKAKEISVVLCDDPFEVKVGDNYELLADEWEEIEKRWMALEKRIQELRREYGLLPASKVEELYASLLPKNATLYIQRSRKLYASSPMRKKLFTWTLKNMEVITLADRSIHGKENVVKHMRDIDPDSPYPEEGLQFTTLWGRMVHMSADQWLFTLRDYMTPWLEMKDLHIWGRLIGAETVPSKRAIRSSTVEVGLPWGDVRVQRSMPPLKFYHDFSCEMSKFLMAYGPCWDPAVAQYNINMNNINKPSIDPSLPLPFWDKARLLFHGRLTMSVSKMHWMYHASLDPYNTTEFMEWTWTNLILDWTNAKWVLRGDLDIFARTASKYDDCRLLHLPNLRFCLKLDWVCWGDPNDHHSVMPCAPDKVPEFSLERHDSYCAFRSQSFNWSLSFETKPTDSGNAGAAAFESDEKVDVPSCVFYSSTLRWMDKVKSCMTNVSRPVRRGKIFNYTPARKPQLSRHAKDISLSVNIHKFVVCYWVSFAKQHGTEMRGEPFQMVVNPHLELIPHSDGLSRRPLSNWTIKYFTSDLQKAAIWLCSTNEADLFSEVGPLHSPVLRSYFLSIEKLAYKRNEPRQITEALDSPQHIGMDNAGGSQEANEVLPRHQVQMHNLKGAWTPSNRDIVFQLYDGFARSQTIKKNLASDALKGFKMDLSHTSNPKNRSSSFGTPPATFAMAPSPLTKVAQGHVHNMLHKLISEADSRLVAVSEEVTGGSVQVDQLHGIIACQTDDVVLRNWHIELYNSQIQLRGCETTGYVIVSASKASILSCEHEPVWKQRQLKSKTTWVGSLECMQYYATLDPSATTKEEHIQWLSPEHIANLYDSQEDSNEPAGNPLSGFGHVGMTEMVGSGSSVGGVVGDSFNADDADGSLIQLQRIISRCRCQFFYANYGEVDLDLHPEIPAPPEESDMMQREEGIDSFTLLHHDLNICTNPSQYAMILDIVNNLLLYVEPKKKENFNKLQNMRFKLQLSNMEDQKTPILEHQNRLRQWLATIRRLEREFYLVHKTLEEDPESEDLLESRQEIQSQLHYHKQMLHEMSEELDIIISCFKESQLQIKQLMTSSKTQESDIIRRNEVCFKHAEWRMTEADGQIGIADLVLRNFLYNKINREDDSGVHMLELGWVKVTNLLPQTIYKDVIVPLDNGQDNHQMALRIICRFKAPVGGIQIKEHFEVNVVPVTIQLTHRLYMSIMNFFFPGKNIEAHEDQTPGDDGDDISLASTTSSKSTSKKRASMRSKASAADFVVDDIDKMKERAARNTMFLYIKIPEVLLRLSYKGSKEKNIQDIHDVNLVLPTLEYHNQTWTWLDFLMAVKKDSKRELISQAIKQKLHMKSRSAAGAGSQAKEDTQELDKAQLLLGARLRPGTEKSSSSRKSIFGKSSK